MCPSVMMSKESEFFEIAMRAASDIFGAATVRYDDFTMAEANVQYEDVKATAASLQTASQREQR